MSGRWQGLRFVHPDLSRGGARPGLRLAATGGLATVGGAAAVRQAVLLLLTTMPGERVMRPDYGCDLRPVMFAELNQTTCGLVIHYVREALRRWEPRIEILRLDAEPGLDEPGRLDIMLEYRVRGRGIEDALHYSVNVAEGGV